MFGDPAPGVAKHCDYQDVSTGAGSLQFSAATYSVSENGVNAVITITRTGGSSGAVGATFATSNGTATAGSDYTAVNQTVSFATGDTTSKTVNIPITNDTTSEFDETVNLTLSSPTGGATLGSQSTAVLTILDDDAPAPAGSLQFSAATYSVNENGGNAVITITRTGGSTGAVGATFATSNGTATAGSDYTAVNQTVNFANGDTVSKTVNIPITTDSSVEGDETVNLTLSLPTGGATLGSQSTAVLTIVDVPPSTWTFCANENQFCSFTGTKLVRYGAGSTFNTLTATNGVSCANWVFGDPVPGVAKHCDYSSP
ncbi:MAG: hypothetical protein EXR70_16600 [Deltaproteobacteria bacterium]|nr:hypothetical protein [Deltaproteobacteria bacterium]